MSYAFVPRMGRTITTNIPRHISFSPNNIKVIESRSKTISHLSNEKITLLAKKVRCLIFETSRNLKNLKEDQYVLFRVEEFKLKMIESCMNAY